MEIVNSIASKISEYAIDAIVHQLGYLVHYNRNIKDFEKQTQDLELARARVKAQIVEAEKQGETIHEHVLAEFTKAEKIIEDIKERNFPNVSCFNLFQRYRSSREAKKLRDELSAFEKKLEKLDKVGYRGPLPWMESNPGDVYFESRTLIMDDIIKALQDPHIYMIGVHGMGGIGKTTLVNQIASQVTKSKLFEPVIMAVVGQNPQVQNIQGQLADKLGFKFEEETERGRAVSLWNRLQQKEKILIIIDDVWNDLDFKKVGIPIPSTNNRKGSKIIVTSRSLSILYNDMSIEKNFYVKDLTEDESWNLFKNQVGESIETNNQFKEIATQITNKCGELPLALVLVAKALKGKDLAVWKDAFRQLNNPSSQGIYGVSKETYTSIRLSYDHLESREAKTLFLLCSMFPDDYDIYVDHLSRYARGLEFLNGVHTLEATRNRIVKLIDDLKSSCLLQKSESMWYRQNLDSVNHSYVKMHDVIRDVAINIASNDDQMCTLSYGKRLNEVQDEKTDRHYTAIFTNCVNFKDLPEELNFSKLKLLTLLDNDKFLQIPEDCFERMGNIKVLHLNGISFSPSPSSFNHLAKLQTLMLINCHVKNIDMIGKLKELEILDFSFSNITELPLSLSQLSGLKQLKLSFCEELKVIQPEVISRMTKLEELFLDCTFNNWQVVESNNSEQETAKARISELGCLPRLICLYLCIPDVRSLPEIEFFNNLELERFNIVIGHTQWASSAYGSEKMLDIETHSRNDVWKELQLLERCEDLRLKGMCGVKNVVSKLKTSVHLRYLKLEDNEDVEYLVSELDQNRACDAFPILETLKLSNMRGLETTIIEGYSFETFKGFEKLKTLDMWSCDKMKYLFPVSIIEGLPNLQRIDIRNCKMMEAIVVVIENETAVDQIQFTRLKKLKLSSLPKLKSFCGKLMKAKRLIESQSTEIVELKEEEDRANSITSFHSQIKFPKLESVSIESVENVWHDLLFGNNIENLRLWNCEDIESVFTVKNNQTLPHLPQDVFRCMPNLKSMDLRDLPNLKNVWNKDIPYGNLITFQSLWEVNLRWCPQLKTLFPHSLTKHLQQLEYISIYQCGIHEIFGTEDSDYSNSEVSFPSLELLEIEDVHNLEVIWHNRLIVDDMSNLQYVKLDKCKSLKSIFTSNVMSALKRLDQLDIQNCDSLEQVFQIHQMIEPKEHRQVASINLRKLVLCNLPSLKHVWSNDPYEMYQFQDLNDVEVTKCPKLITLFPPSKARDLRHQLQCLQSDFDLERAKEEAQTLESVLVLEDNDFVIGKDRAKIRVSTLLGRNILFYFSADSSSACRAFLPKLIEAYHKIKEKNDNFEVIFISSDRDESSFDQIFSRMPWLALPFGDPRKASVSRTFKVQRIPMLVAIGSDGRTVTKDVIDLIRIHGAEAYPFTAGRVGELEIEKEEIAKRGSEKVKHTLHEGHELVLSRRKRYICDGCNENGRLWSYLCKECDFDLHPNCALENRQGNQQDGNEG